MPLPLLAFLGMGLGTKYGLDKYNQARANQQAGENFKRAQGFIGAPGQPLNTGVGPLLQGEPGMSQATGMFSPNQAERAQSAVGLMSTPGYAPMGAQLMTDIARNRAGALKARSLAPLFNPQMQPAVQQFPDLAAQTAFSSYGKPPPSGPFPGTGVQASALNLYHTLSRKDKLTEDEKSALNLAKWQLQQPRPQYDPQTGQTVMIQPPALPRVVQPGTTLGTEKAPVPGKAPGTVDKQLRFTKGSRDYIAAQKEVQAYGRAQNNIKRMMKLIQEHGTEAYGPVSAQMATIYGQITADIATLRDMGVLQAGELENIQGQIQDPSKVKSIFASKATLASGYKELEQMFNAKLKDSLKIYKPMGLDYEETPSSKSGYLTYDPKLLGR